MLEQFCIYFEVKQKSRCGRHFIGEQTLRMKVKYAQVAI